MTKETEEEAEVKKEEEAEVKQEDEAEVKQEDEAEVKQEEEAEVKQEEEAEAKQEDQDNVVDELSEVLKALTVKTPKTEPKAEVNGHSVEPEETESTAASEDPSKWNLLELPKPVDPNNLPAPGDRKVQTTPNGNLRRFLI